MSANQKTDRSALLERGWYVATGIETAFLGLSGKAHDLLIVIKHLQGGQSDAFPCQKTLAAIMKWSERTLQRVLAELTKKGVLKIRRTGRASRYAAVYIQATTAEIRILLGSEVAVPHDLVASDTTTGGGSDTSDSGGSLPYKEPPTNNQNENPSLREGGDAGTPQMEMQEAEMTWTRTPEPEDDLDPVASLGLWETQEAPETEGEGLGALFPASEVQSPASGRSRRRRSQAQQDAPMALALDFETALRATDWAGPAPVNRAALARNLSAWRRDGLTADQVRSMMRRYIDDPRMRGKGIAPWQEFVWRRHKLLAAIANTTAVRAVEDHRHDADSSYWLGTMAGGQ